MAKRISNAPAETPGAALALDGRTSPKRRAARKGDISEEQLETFFETLADSCNVVLSARRAGFTANWAYRKRKHDAAFRNQWAAAVREGYAKLELVLLERAMKGTPKTVRGSGGSDTIIREYSNTLAIALLRRHAETVDGLDGLPDEDGCDELRTRILEQLDRLRDQAGAAAGEEIETKNAAGRLALIVRALRA